MLSNSQTVGVQTFLPRIKNLLQDLEAYKDSRKETVKQMKAEGLPATELIKLRSLDPEKEAEAALRLQLAGQILGREVYAERVDAGTPDGNIDVAKANEYLDAVAELDEQIRATKEDLKEVKKEAKAAKLVPDILERVALFQINPEKAADYRENDLLIRAYVKAIQAVDLIPD